MWVSALKPSARIARRALRNGVQSHVKNRTQEIRRPDRRVAFGAEANKRSGVWCARSMFESRQPHGRFEVGKATIEQPTRETGITSVIVRHSN